MEDPEENLLTMTSISMTPIPCAMEAKGIFQEDLTSVDLDIDVEVHPQDGQSAKIIAVKDTICDWATLEQEGRSICPPQKGPATITARLELAQGWVMEAIYLMVLKLASGNQMLTHIEVRVELKNVGIGTSLPNTTFS